MLFRRALLSVLTGVVCLPGVFAQGPRGTVTKWPVERYAAADRDFTRIVVKFVEGPAVRLRGGAFVGAADLAGANRLLRDGVEVRRLFARSEAQLDAEFADLQRRLPAGLDAPADLNNYYHVQVATPLQGKALMRAFNALEVVEIAFPEHRLDVDCDPGDIPPVTPLFTSSQGYRSAAPLGINHKAGRTIGGGRGHALQFTDIETGWYLDHEDVPGLVQAAVIGPNPTPRDHGLAVVGELAAERDQFGMVGLVDLAQVKVHSHQSQFWASSVNTAAANTPVGGVVILEVQLPLGGTVVPMENRQDVFDAVRNATLAGKFVIAAAGNGNADLDDTARFGRIFDRTFRDSGAILVGATDGSQLVRAGFSNHGSIVDCNGWGFNVYTTGYGDLFQPGGDKRQSYTATFSGTSSATPICTGAAMALVGAVLEQQGRLMAPSELRGLLQQHGTPVPNGRIGVRPDLEKLLAAVGLPDGLSLPQEATIGGTMTVELTAPAGADYIVMVAFGRGEFDLGAAGRFLLDPASAVAWRVGVMGGAGSQQFNLSIPNDVTLRKADVFFQAGTVVNNFLDLTNSVNNYIL